MQSESGTHKVSDSGYSNSCSNSQSQRSGSSKSHSHSESNSSRSSGYGGGGRHPNTNASSSGSGEVNQKTTSKRNKDKDIKKKKSKGNVLLSPYTELGSAIEDQNNSTVITENVSDEIKKETTGTTNSENKNCNIDTEVLQNLPVSHKSPQVPTATATAESTQTEINGVQLWSSTCSASGLLPPDGGATVPIAASASEGVTKDNLPVHSEPQSTNKPHTKTSPELEDGFFCVISMHDGVVLYTTPNLTTILGFPQDMWLGRSFIDFVHPKDRVTFASHITTDVAIPLAETDGHIKECKKNSIHVSLRKYRGLKSNGFGVIEKQVAYKPFHLSLIFRQITPDPTCFEDKGLYLIISAQALRSPYEVPNEVYVSTKFCLRHTATCEITHVDPDVVIHFGFLPQNMLGHSILEFIHPEDLPILNKVYEKVVAKAQVIGSVFKSQPYRFLTQNGTYALVETDWSCFINPWTRQLEFIIGHHRILQGPSNPNVFEKKSKNVAECEISEAVRLNGKQIREKIEKLLVLKLPRTNNNVKEEVTKRCKDLATFMESLMDDVSNSNQIKLEMPADIDPSFSERDSVMLGEISPHHDYYDSKSSSETPPSYNQLNYNENLQRFFESKPMTKPESDGSGGVTGNTDMELEAKNNDVKTPVRRDKHFSPLQTSGDSGSGSADNSSGGGNPNTDNGNTSGGTNTSNPDSYKPPTLTEELLVKHNEDMEKIMAKRHREFRSIIKGDREHRTRGHYRMFQSHDRNYLQAHNHGIKRSGSHSWEGDYHKQSKHKHTPYNEQTTADHNIDQIPILPPPEFNANGNSQQTAKTTQPPTNNVNLWPPFSVSVTAVNNTNQCSTTFAGGMIPVYYITQPGQLPHEHPGPPTPYPLPCLPNVVYPSMYPSPVMYSSLALLHPLAVPVAITPVRPNIVPAIAQAGSTPVTKNCTQIQHQLNGNKAHRAGSQPTSVKAEPGSAIGSIASNSNQNRALSESSKRDLGVQSLCSLGSPRVSMPDQDVSEGTNAPAPAKLNDANENKLGGTNGGSMEGDGESSYSSFYSSFLKTEASVSYDDNTNSDNKEPQNRNLEEEDWEKRKPQRLKRKTTPPWLEAVKVTPELIYQYQLSLKDASDILQADLLTLKEINQPMLVNDQLSQLYLDLELEGLSQKLTLEDGITSSSSSGEETSVKKKTLTKKRRSYSQMVMIYEADAPLPPPDQ